MLKDAREIFHQIVLYIKNTVHSNQSVHEMTFKRP